MVTRAASRQATHDKVLATAERMFRERGYRATTVRDIAVDAEVSVGSVMAVGDKAQLLVAVFDGEIQRIHDERRREGLPSRTDGSTPGEQLLSVVEPFLALFSANAHLYREYSAILTSGNHESTLFRGLADDLVGEFAAVLTASGMHPEDVPVAAKATYFAYLGVIRSSAANATGDPAWALDDLRAVFTYLATSKGQS